MEEIMKTLNNEKGHRESFHSIESEISDWLRLSGKDSGDEDTMDACIIDKMALCPLNEVNTRLSEIEVSSIESIIISFYYTIYILFLIM